MIAKLLFFFFLMISSLNADDVQARPTESSYHLGEGMKVASLPLYLGGYFSLDYRNMQGENRYRLDDIALLSYGNYNRFSYMAELEYKSFYVVNENKGKYTTTRDDSLHTERLYVNYAVDENYNFRVGKYSTQAGFWNLLPINVLRDTTSVPMSTNIIFPKFTTGVLLSYKSYNDASLNMDVMIQNNRDLDAVYNNYKMDEHYGVGIGYEKDNLAVKFNFGLFDGLFANSRSQNLYYYMASFKYTTEKIELMGEVGSQKTSQVYTTKYAGYLQGAYHFTQEHIGVLRLESYDDRSLATKEDIAIFGYSYRPLYPVSLKAEYQFHSIHKNNQTMFSISVLF